MPKHKLFQRRAGMNDSIRNGDKVVITDRPGEGEFIVSQLGDIRKGECWIGKEEENGRGWFIFTDRLSKVAAKIAAVPPTNEETLDVIEGTKVPEVAEAHADVEDNTGIERPATTLPEKLASPHEDGVAELTKRIQKKVKELKLDGTVGMSKDNLRQLVDIRGLTFANPNHFHRSFDEALQNAGLGKFVIASRKQASFRVQVYAEGTQVETKMFKDQDKAETFFEQQADHYKGDKGIKVFLDELDGGEELNLKKASTKTAALPISPSKAYEIASSWGSYMNNSDPGAVFYSFPAGKAKVIDEDHRKALLKYTEDCLAKAKVRVKEAKGKDIAEAKKDVADLEALKVYFQSAPLSPEKSESQDSDDFYEAYVEAALWSTHAEDAPRGGENLDEEYGPEDLAPQTKAQMEKDCKKFQADNAELLQTYYDELPSTEWSPESQAGHDFWLSRNGHGAGFSDRDVSDEVRDALQEAAQQWEEFNLYVGGDDKIYAEGYEKPELKLGGLIVAAAEDIKTFEETAGTNWISDLGHYLTTQVEENNWAEAKIVRNWDYKTNTPYKDPKPTDIVRAKKRGLGTVFSLNNGAPTTDFVRLVTNLSKQASTEAKVELEQTLKSLRENEEAGKISDSFASQMVQKAYDKYDEAIKGGEEKDYCAECGRPVLVDENEVTYHLTEDGDLDPEQDGNHVALLQSKYGSKTASEVNTAKALKLAEDIQEELQALYLKAKPITMANESRPARDGVEAIYAAVIKLSETKKILLKQLRQEEKEEEDAEAQKGKGKKSSVGGLIVAGVEVVKEPTEGKNASLGGLRLAAAEGDGHPYSEPNSVGFLNAVPTEKLKQMLKDPGILPNIREQAGKELEKRGEKLTLSFSDIQSIQLESDEALIDEFLDAQHDERYAETAKARERASEVVGIADAELKRRHIASSKIGELGTTISVRQSARLGDDMQTTVSKAINEWQVIEDNGGGLHLFIYGDGGIDGGEVIYAHSGYEYNKGQLSADLDDLDAGGNVAGWDGCVEGDLQEYRDSYNDASTSPVVAQGADGERRLFTRRMGSAARLEFGVGEDLSEPEDEGGPAGSTGKRQASKKCGDCGHPWESHNAPPDFSCHDCEKCKGWADKKPKKAEHQEASEAWQSKPFYNFEAASKFEKEKRGQGFSTSREKLNEDSAGNPDKYKYRVFWGEKKKSKKARTHSSKDRVEFAHLLKEHAPYCQNGSINKHVSDTIAEDIMRLGHTYKKIQEMWLGEPMDPESTAKFQQKEQDIEDRIQGFASQIGVTALFDGNPEVPTIKLNCPDGFSNDDQKQGIVVPTS